MALRIMQIFLPRGSDLDSNEMLAGHPILGRWRDFETEQTVLLLLVQAEETEPIMDRFEERYAEVDDFHVVLYPVEGALPRPAADEAEEKDEKEQEDAAQQGPRINREELYNDARESFSVDRVFLGMTLLSALVAAAGLIRDDVTVIVGAMVIAPLLGPNVALSLAAILADGGLFRRALLATLIGVAVTLLVAVCVGAIFPFDPEVSAIASRTELRPGDVALAFAAGMAGALAFTRGQSNAVIGVMVAVALVPPLVCGGMLLGAGDIDLALGAFLLSAANVLCVNLAAMLTFFAQGVRPSGWHEASNGNASRRALLIWFVFLGLLAAVVWLGLENRKASLDEGAKGKQSSAHVPGLTFCSHSG